MKTEALRPPVPGRSPEARPGRRRARFRLTARSLLPVAALATFVASGAVAAPDVPAAEKALQSTQRLLLPYYSVDTTSILGSSTLFAVRNEGLSTITVTASYYELDSPQAPQRTDVYQLQAKQIRTVQIRDVANLEVDEDGFARGYVIFETASLDQLVHGDYLQVTPGQAFATGGRLVDVSGGPFDELCSSVSVRYLNGGAFTGGTRFVYWLSATSLPLPANAITYSVYDEAGIAPIFTSNLPTATVAGEVDIEQLLGPFNVNFGAVEFQFADELEGHVIAIMSASNEFSIRVEATCR